MKGEISIDADSGPPRYVPLCCGSICHQLPTFFQIGSGHTVVPYTFRGFVKLFVEKVASIVGNRQKPKDKQKVS